MPVSNNKPTTVPTPLAAQIANAQLQRGESKYVTTTDSCNCPDHMYRKRICKHMIALIKETSSPGLCMCGVPWCDGDHREEVKRGLQ